MSNVHLPGGDHGAGGHSAGGDMNLAKIIIVGVGSLALFAVGIGWSYEMMVRRQNDLQAAAGLPRIPTEIGKPEIGIVDQVPFENDHRLDDWRRDRKRRLTSYGWIDKSQGIAHIPIEKAMEQVVAQPPAIDDEGAVPTSSLPSIPGAAAAPSPAPPPGVAGSRKAASP